MHLGALGSMCPCIPCTPCDVASSKVLHGLWPTPNCRCPRPPALPAPPCASCTPCASSAQCAPCVTCNQCAPCAPWLHAGHVKAPGFALQTRGRAEGLQHVYTPRGSNGWSWVTETYLDRFLLVLCLGFISLGNNKPTPPTAASQGSMNGLPHITIDQADAWSETSGGGTNVPPHAAAALNGSACSQPVRCRWVTETW